MSLEELSKFTIISKYAKYLKTERRRETWDEIVERSRDMHLKKFSALPERDRADIAEAFEFVRRKQVLPSMRSAQNAGPGIEQKNERIYNCCFFHINDTRAIEKAFYLLLCGVGCGFGLREKWVSQFPEMTEKTGETLVYAVADSIEGWANSVKALVDSYLEGNEYSGREIIFSYEHIRPKGAEISHGGKAPGPGGLRHTHEMVRQLLDNRTGRLRPIDVYDILMHVSDAVLSGGIRRAACIALFDLTDEEMMRAKTGNWWVENPQRARSNNTVLLKRDEVTEEDFHRIMESTRQFGEPGFAFVDDLDTGVNPCAEISFLPFYEGRPAVQFCNLTTVNGNKAKSEKELFSYVWAATVIGTLQASYTDFKFLDEDDRLMTEEEALLGVSIMGYLSNPELLLNEELLRAAAEYAVRVNEEWAAKLGIRPAARVTCTKPDGNSSCVLESPFSGIHPAHAPYYLRRAQVNRDDAIYRHFRASNPEFCERSVYSATGTDDIITFPVRVEGGLMKADVLAIEHLELIRKVNSAWVRSGEKHNRRPIHHSISCTVLVHPDEWEAVGKYLYENREHFTTVSLLARSGEKDYAQAPYEAIGREEYEALAARFREVDYRLLSEADDQTAHSEEVACAGGACTI